MITVDRENNKLIVDEKSFPLAYALCCPVTDNPVFVIVQAHDVFEKLKKNNIPEGYEKISHYGNILGISFYFSDHVYLNPFESNDDEDERASSSFIYLYGLKDEFLIQQAYKKCSGTLRIIPNEMTYDSFKEKLLTSQVEKVHIGREVVKGRDLIITIEC